MQDKKFKTEICTQRFHIDVELCASDSSCALSVDEASSEAVGAVLELPRVPVKFYMGCWPVRCYRLVQLNSGQKI